MGCSSSKSLEMQARRDGWNPPISRSFVRSLSMPLRQQQKSLPQPLRFHSVALTSSTYGALKIPDVDEDGIGYASIENGEKEEEAAMAAPLAAGAKDLEGRIEASPPAPLDLSKPAALPSVPEAEVIDLWELMKDLTDETENVEEDSSAGSRHKSMVSKRRAMRSRALSRSISSVDSMRELDVKIRSVALALPNFEKKLRALDALNSISRGVADEEEQVFFRYRKSREDFQSNSVKSSPARGIIDSTKSMKGLFYGATLEELRAQSTSIATVASTSSSSSSSSSSYDASSSCGDSEESSSLFDPEVLKTFQQPEEGQGEQQQRSIQKVAPPVVSKKMMSSKVLAIDQVEEKTLLDGLAAVCPPRGERRAVLYVTSLRGIRKTFEDCGKVRMILQGFGVAIDERDVSMHAEFRQELKELLVEVAERKNAAAKGSPAPPMPVPRLFIGGRYVGGVEEVSQMNEDGLIGRLVEGLPRQSSVAACEGCGGVRFVPCLECSGSCKVVVFGGGVGDFSGSGVVVRCSYCNENGLIRCPVCL
ncbi:uncharacterized protein LOC9636390 [Selaginella moellendorffii]|nr:uncharacterized protein LOC9636390 [Selaginella moellendorffii]|eukprot:XP_024519126.1 uncharacterized protein LOC9636390 [Selaginella moellendorffii]